MSTFERIRSGLPGLDSMLDSIRMGDNVVWQVSSMDDYMHFVAPLCNQLYEEGKELLYMHFSGHPALLHTLQQAYQYPVDIEFTINGTDTGEFVFNLLQCRPLQVGTRRDAVTVPSLPEDKTVFSVTGSSMGGSRAEDIDYVVFVDSRAYYEFPYKRKPDIAHIIGDINHHFRKSNQNLLLFVPGRIGTSSPELGVPVSFAAINHFCAICEMSDSEVGYMPELSYGSHMFQDLVEAEIFYTALFDTPKTRIFTSYKKGFSMSQRRGLFSFTFPLKSLETVSSRCVQIDFPSSNISISACASYSVSPSKQTVPSFSGEKNILFKGLLPQYSSHTGFQIPVVCIYQQS